MIKIKTPGGVRFIGPGQPCFVVAEMSGNHNHDLKKAYRIIDEAVKAGVDAVKLQTYTADTLTIDCDNKYFQIKVNDAWKGKTLYGLYQKAFTPWEWQADLKKYCESKGMLLFSTPFDETAVDFLEKLKVVIYKVASFEVVDLMLLKRIGQTKKPVIMSRGMASIEEIKTAIRTLKQAGCPKVAVLQCVSSYPATPEQMNLATIPDLNKKFKVMAGLSDHTLSTTVALTSVALGAHIVEKHFTLRRADGGPDAAFSLEPEELRNLVKTIREVEQAIGKPTYKTDEKEAENKIFRRSLFVVRNIREGEKLTKENIRCIRPGFGLNPKYFDKVIGKTAKKDIARGTPLMLSLIK